MSENTAAVADLDVQEKFNARWNAMGKRLYELSPELWASTFALLKLIVANLGGEQR